MAYSKETTLMLLGLMEQGAAAWNAWANDNPTFEIEFRQIDFGSPRAPLPKTGFSDFVFPDKTTFVNCKFPDNAANFEACHFNGEIKFSSCDFEKAIFHRAIFNAPTVFSYSEFQYPLDLSDAIFASHLTIENSTFSGGMFSTESIFHGETNISKCRFTDLLDLNESTFGLGLILEKSTMHADAELHCIKSRMGIRISNCTFKQNLFCTESDIFGNFIFEVCTVESEAVFADSSFHQDADFNQSRFLGPCSFGGSKFMISANFKACEFSGPTSFSRCIFYSVPDLRMTSIKRHISFHDVSVFPKWIPAFTWHPASILQKAEYRDDEDKLRRLKELAKQAENHQQEINFFSEELKAKRYWSETGTNLILNYAYDLFSNFGRSFIRPLTALSANILLFSFIYWKISQSSISQISTFITFSAAQALPFFGTSRLISQWNNGLFPAPLRTLVGTLGIVEGIISATFIFLFLLAVRNRFRL